MGHPGHTKAHRPAARHGVGRSNQPDLLPQRHSRATRVIVDRGAPSDMELVRIRELLDRISSEPSDLVAQPGFATEIVCALANLRGSINTEALPEMALRLALHRLGHEFYIADGAGIR